jgi:hypothetical protein
MTTANEVEERLSRRRPSFVGRMAQLRQFESAFEVGQLMVRNLPEPGQIEGLRPMMLEEAG